MDTKISYLIIDEIRKGVSGKIDKCQPRLNFEMTDFLPENLVSVLGGFLSDWGCNHFFLIKMIGNNLDIVIFEKKNLNERIAHHLDGSVISIVDPSTLEGVTFDMDIEGSSTFTLTGWGDKGEKVAFLLEQVFPSGVIFEGN